MLSATAGCHLRQRLLPVLTAENSLACARFHLRQAWLSLHCLTSLSVTTWSSTCTGPSEQPQLEHCSPCRTIAEMASLCLTSAWPLQAMRGKVGSHWIRVQELLSAHGLQKAQGWLVRLRMSFPTVSRYHRLQLNCIGAGAASQSVFPSA